MNLPVRRRPLRLAWLLLLLAGLLLPVGLALQREPRLAASPPGAQAQLANQARRLWAQLRPGAAPAGALRQTRLGEAELNALLAQAAQTQGGRWRARLRIDSGSLLLEASQPAPGLPAWLNLTLHWDLRDPQPGRLPALTSAQLGNLPLPPSWVEAAALRWLRARTGDSLETLLPMLEAYRAAPRQLWLFWRWQPQRAAEAMAGLWCPAEGVALRTQHEHLRQLLAGVLPGHAVELPQLLTPMAAAALQRVGQGASDAAAELRALLAVLALQTVGRDIRPWLPEAQSLPPSPRVLLLLAGRDDMASHFLIAALLSWQGGERVSAALGLAKELADARSGSGFSFNDLAADAAGTRFGQFAARQPTELLALLATGPAPASYFPDIAGLPEFLSEAEFRRRYGQLDSPAYQQEMARVRERVAALPIYQGFPGR